MELKHSFTVPASVQETWDTFMDLESVGGCFPGATVTEVSDDGFAGTVKVKLGPIALVYSGTGSFVEKDEEAKRAVIKAQGKDKRGNGTAGATVTIQLTADGSSTRADVGTDLAITGKPAQFGRGVMQDVSDKLLGQFVNCIEGKFDAAEAEPQAQPEAPAGTPEAAPAAAGSAPTDAGSASSEPAPSEPAPSGPAPSGPAPSGPAQSEPAPTGAAGATVDGGIPAASAASPSPATAPARPAASPPTRASSRAQEEDDDNALSGLSLVPIILKGIWNRLLVALKLRKPDA